LNLVTLGLLASIFLCSYRCKTTWAQLMISKALFYTILFVETIYRYSVV
jgi:hypothetical protein